MKTEEIKNIIVSYGDNDFVRVFDWIGKVTFDTATNLNICGGKVLEDSVDIENFLHKMKQTASIKKIKELDNAVHPNNIVEGSVRFGYFLKLPKKDERFILYPSFVTSAVTEIIDEFTFKTLNSIYQLTYEDSII